VPNSVGKSGVGKRGGKSLVDADDWQGIQAIAFQRRNQPGVDERALTRARWRVQQHDALAKKKIGQGAHLPIAAEEQSAHGDGLGADKGGLRVGCCRLHGYSYRFSLSEPIALWFARAGSTDPGSNPNRRS
jgi:hypothetical protein